MTLRLAALACALLVLAPPPSAAQVAYDSPHGRVEIFGLKRWTLAMLQDSIRRYAPGKQLHDAACMVTLRDSLHFAEASVERFEVDVAPDQPPRSYLAIKVIEPRQASRVRWDVRPRSEYSAMLPGYAPVVLPITDSVGFLAQERFVHWLQFPDGAARSAAITRAPSAGRVDGERVVTFLAAHRTEADRAQAMRVVAADGYWVNRMVAAAALSNFAAHDSTWWILVRALRDPNAAVRSAAGLALKGMPSRRIDWRPAAADLRLLLNGTNLPAITEVFSLLTRTEIDSALAPTLLRGNADWILEHLGSEIPGVADAAHSLLVRLNAGRDLGRRRSAWAAWARSL